jgi:hypothetical protein
LFVFDVFGFDKVFYLVEWLYQLNKLVVQEEELMRVNQKWNCTACANSITTHIKLSGKPTCANKHRQIKMVTATK